MKKISLILLGIFIALNLYAQEEINQNQAKNIDKLDVLDKQSKEFFNAITGLEKDYLQEQVNAIKNKKENPNAPLTTQEKTLIKEEPKDKCRGE